MFVNKQPRVLKNDDIKFLEGCISKSNSETDNLCLSNYQIPDSKSNYQDIKSIQGPALYEAGYDSGGMTAYYYYKSLDQEIYLLNFWIQKFTSCFKINNAKWENMLNYVCVNQK